MAGAKVHIYEGTPGVEVLSKPVFIVEVPRRGRKPVYYLTLGVWEYDIEEPGITPKQTAGCTKVASLFSGQAKKVTAALFKGGAGGGDDGLGQQTNP
jgi:hypothetical protein